LALAQDLDRAGAQLSSRTCAVIPAHDVALPLVAGYIEAGLFLILAAVHLVNDRKFSRVRNGSAPDIVRLNLVPDVTAVAAVAALLDDVDVDREVGRQRW